MADDGVALLGHLDSILSSDPLIDELGFVHPSQLASLHETSSPLPLSHEENDGETPASADPSAFWCADHKLAIAVPALAPLYRAAKSAFLATRRDYQFLLLKSRGQAHVHAPSECHNTQEDLHCLVQKLLSYTRAVVILNSAYKSAWHARKQIFKDVLIEVPLAELQLSSLALSFNPKCEEAWAHRRWVIQSRLVSLFSGQLPEELLQGELKLIEMVGERSRMNYRAWCHCYWLVPLMSPLQVLHELQQWKRWAQLHVADNCCFHFRRCLFQRLLTENKLMEAENAWLDEIEWNEGLIKSYIGREALWVHRRFLFFMWTQDFKQTNGACLHKNLSTEKNDWHQQFPECEIKFANMCIASCSDDETEDAQRQLVYASTYKLWVLMKWKRSSTSSSTLQLWQKELCEVEQLLRIKAAHQKNLWEGLFGDHARPPDSMLFS